MVSELGTTRHCSAPRWLISRSFEMRLYREKFSGAVKRSRLKYRVIRSDGVNGEVSDPRVSGIRQILASGDGGQPLNTDGALRFALRVVEIT
jgi:hypothetical protein